MSEIRKESIEVRQDGQFVEQGGPIQPELKGFMSASMKEGFEIAMIPGTQHPRQASREEMAKRVNEFLQNTKKETALCIGDLSDGYHSFDVLYNHRILLFILAAKYMGRSEREDFEIWRSKLHHDGTSYDGWFIMGIILESGEQISYHLPMDKWDMTAFVPTWERAPEWDGHTSNDVLKRIEQIIVGL